jgi:hypothetical protein
MARLVCAASHRHGQSPTRLIRFAFVSEQEAVHGKMGMPALMDLLAQATQNVSRDLEVGGFGLMRLCPIGGRSWPRSSDRQNQWEALNSWPYSGWTPTPERVPHCAKSKSAFSYSLS